MSKDKNLLVESLIENPYINDNVLSFYGYMNNGVLNEILKVTKTKLVESKESATVISRIYNSINECAENIIKHSAFPKENMIEYRSMILVAFNKIAYNVDSINRISNLQKQLIEKQLSFLNSKSKEELKKIKSGIISNTIYSDVSTAGLGIIDMIIKADEFKYSFKKKEDDDYLFNLHFKINTLNN